MNSRAHNTVKMFTPPLNFTTSRGARILKNILLIVGIVLVMIGFFQEVSKSSSRKTLWILDTSLSMLAQDIRSTDDIYKSRLDLAKHIILSWSQLIGGEHALLSASQWAKLESPLTDNLSNFQDIVNGLQSQLRGGGSSIYTPLQIADSIYGQGQHIKIFWITDGEFFDMWGFSGRTYPNLTFIAVGTPGGTNIIEWYDTAGKPQYKESGGARVVTKRSDDNIRILGEKLKARSAFLDRYVLPDFWESIKREEFSWNLLILLGVSILLIALVYPQFSYKK